MANPAPLPVGKPAPSCTSLLRQPLTAIIAVLLAAFLVRLLWLDRPAGVLIFDEQWYVSAARTILALPQPPDAKYANALLGHDPNLEHPPLGKLLIAGSMLLAGDNAYGWRWPSVLAGMLSIAFVYRIARLIGLPACSAVLAAFLLAFDTLAYVQGRQAMLDGLMLLGIVAGLCWFLEGRPLLAGLAFALGTLCKEAGAIGAVVALANTAAAWLSGTTPPARIPGRRLVALPMLGGYVVILFALWWALDLHWTAVPNPLAHLAIMRHDAAGGLHLTAPVPNAGPPWQWVVDEVPVPYLTIGDRVRPAVGTEPVTVVRIAFRGVLNPFLVWAVPLALGFAVLLVRRRADRAALLALTWAAVAVLPFVTIALVGRYTFLSYALPAVPALALAVARVAAEPGFPRPLVWVYIAAVAYRFIIYFPFVGFRCC